MLVQFFIVEPEALQQDRKRLLAGGLKVDYVGFGWWRLGSARCRSCSTAMSVTTGSPPVSSPALGLIAGISLLTLVVWELFQQQPAMNVRLLRSSAFAISCLVMFLFGFMLISMTQLLPQLSQTLMGYDATLAGLTLGLGGFATIVADADRRSGHWTVHPAKMADPGFAGRHRLGAVVEPRGWIWTCRSGTWRWSASRRWCGCRSCSSR